MVLKTELNQLHLASLGGDGSAMSPAMELALAASFGSLSRWREDFAAMHKAAAADAGWLLLVFQPSDGTLTNQWLAGHQHLLVEGIPVLALDMREPAQTKGLGVKDLRSKDLRIDEAIDALLGRIDWAAVHARYHHAVVAASQDCGASHDDVANALLLDVRREGVCRAAPSQLVNAQWLDPAAVGQWGASLPTDRDIVVYCVYGHEVGRATALRLRAAGLKARYLHGGIDGWQAAGRTLAAKDISA